MVNSWIVLQICPIDMDNLFVDLQGNAIYTSCVIQFPHTMNYECLLTNLIGQSSSKNNVVSMSGIVLIPRQVFQLHQSFTYREIICTVCRESAALIPELMVHINDIFLQSVLLVETILYMYVSIYIMVSLPSQASFASEKTSVTGLLPSIENVCGDSRQALNTFSCWDAASSAILTIFRIMSKDSHGIIRNGSQNSLQSF